MLFPKIHYGQAPNLGTTANFVLFTSSGAVGNTGTSSFKGDIGTNNGAITGFSTSIVYDGSFYNADSITQRAKKDLDTAYSQLSNTTATNTTHAAAFGSGETITTGVYSVAGAGSVAGSLTLDAEGNPSAVFILKFGGAFTTGASTTIILTNGAIAANVFWLAEGAIAMGASTKMKGTLIANNAAISMATGGNLEGRMLSTTGAVAFGPGSAYKPGTTITNIPLNYCCVLRSTANFVMFTSNGAVGNTGTSTITGNIGTHNGATTGFGTSTVNGSFYNGDYTTQRAKKDLDTAYSQLSIC